MRLAASKADIVIQDVKKTKWGFSRVANELGAPSLAASNDSPLNYRIAASGPGYGFHPSELLCGRTLQFEPAAARPPEPEYGAHHWRDILALPQCDVQIGALGATDKKIVEIVRIARHLRIDVQCRHP